MSIGVLFGILASFLWGLTNHIDKRKNNIKELVFISQ